MLLRRLFESMIFTLFIALSVGTAQTLEEVLAKHYSARGGLDRIKSINTMHTKGKMNRMGMEFGFTSYYKRPKSMRTEVLIQGQKIIQAYDGSKGWMINPMMGSTEPQDTPEEATSQYDEQADMDGFLIDWKEKGHTLELTGKEDVEGTDAYVIKVTTKKGKLRKIYIDADSYLELKQEGKITAQGQEIDIESYPSSYKEVNGVMMPFSMESKMGGRAVGQLVMDTIIVNMEMPDSLFIKPAPAK